MIGSQDRLRETDELRLSRDLGIDEGDLLVQLASLLLQIASLFL